MSRRPHQLILRLVVVAGLASATMVFAIQPAVAQNAFDRGTPAESKGGLSGLSSYAQDKIETINLANGNLAIHLPLATIGGRGSASYTIALAYNSKLWTGQRDVETIVDPFGNPITTNHFSATYDDGTLTKPNLIPLGSGWFISRGPSLKVQQVTIDSVSCGGGPENQVHKYVLTKLTLVLPDGSEVEMRDDLTDGAPYLRTLPCNFTPDRDRGRSWHSTDGSAISYVTDVANGVVTGQLNGYVFLSDGTRLRMNANGRCTKITDPNGNFIGINYNFPTSGVVTYTDTLGRVITLQPTAGGAAVTIKGYDGLADRVINVEADEIGAVDGSGNPVNLRSDYWSLQRPFISGDYDMSCGGCHGIFTPHTDLFWDDSVGLGSDIYGGYTEIDSQFAVTRLSLLDGRSFTFRYNKYGELAEIVYPGGGVSQIDYGPFGTHLCETGAAGPMNPMLNRRVSQRRVSGDGTTAVWTYARDTGLVGGTNYPRVTVEVRKDTIAGALLMSEKHYFLALDADYRLCSGGNPSGTGNVKWQNAKEFRVERLTGTGTQVEDRQWQQKASVLWAPDPGSGTNAYANDPLHGQEQTSNDDRMTREDSILENGKLKRVLQDYDIFNNVTRVREYDFGVGTQGVLLRDTTRSYLASQNGYCYTNRNGVNGGCGSGLYTTPEQVIHRRRLLLNETVKDGVGNVEAYTEYEYDNYLNDGGNHAAIEPNAGMIQYDTGLFVPFVSRVNRVGTRRR